MNRLKKNYKKILFLSLNWFHLKPKFGKFLAKWDHNLRVVGDDERLVVSSDGLTGPVEGTECHKTVVDYDKLVMHQERMFIVPH